MRRRCGRELLCDRDWARLIGPRDAGMRADQPFVPSITVSVNAKATFTMPFGAALQPHGVRFRIWAPEAQTLQLVLRSHADPIAMTRDAEGWFELTTPQARAGSLYRFRLPNGLCVPDPASRFQPEDVNGPSEVIDPEKHRWALDSWTCCSW